MTRNHRSQHYQLLSRFDGHPESVTSASGFSLIELLVGVVLVGITAAAAAAILSSSNRALVGARTQDRRQALIDDDVARINNLSTRFTCCSGTCGLSTTGCLSSTPGNDRLYYPQLDSDPNTAIPETAPQLEDPSTGACNNGGIATAFIAQIQSSVPTTALATLNVSRTAPVRVSTTDGRDHRVRLTYRDSVSNRELRVVDIQPIAASFCP